MIYIKESDPHINRLRTSYLEHQKV